MSPKLCSRSFLFTATVKHYKTLTTDQWPVCAFISQEYRPTNRSKGMHNVDTSYRRNQLKWFCLLSDVVERLIKGGDVKCRYGANERERERENFSSTKLNHQRFFS